MKLESKHVLPYVLYGAKMITEPHLFDNKYKTWTLQPSNFPNKWVTDFHSKICLKPLLELSDLITTEFVNYVMGMSYNEEIVNLFCLEFTNSEEKLIDLDLTTLPYQCIEFMFKNHYDFFNLIPQGLAVDINTLSVE